MCPAAWASIEKGVVGEKRTQTALRGTTWQNSHSHLGHANGFGQHGEGIIAFVGVQRSAIIELLEQFHGQTQWSAEISSNVVQNRATVQENFPITLAHGVRRCSEEAAEPIQIRLIWPTFAGGRRVVGSAVELERIEGHKH